jgi:hypothetical protein
MKKSLDAIEPILTQETKFCNKTGAVASSNMNR